MAAPKKAGVFTGKVAVVEKTWLVLRFTGLCNKGLCTALSRRYEDHALMAELGGLELRGKTIVNAECRALLSLARQRKPLGVGAFSVSLGRFLNHKKVNSSLPHHAFFTAG